MNQLHLVNEYTSHNLGDAVIYETYVQLGAPLTVHSRMPEAERLRVRGLAATTTPQPGDVFASVGGDIFNNARPWAVTRRFLDNVSQLGSKPPERTFLFGQSIPSSCRGLALRYLAHTLQRLSSVTVRDEQSHARLRALGVQARLSWDIAFAYEVGARAGTAGQALFDEAGIAAERCVLISVREFDAMYPHDSALFMARIADLCNRLLQRGHRPALLIQASAQGADSDLATARELARRVPDLGVLNPFALGPEHHPVDAVVGALGLAHAVAAVRYHTAVLRLIAGRQAFSLHYSNKGQDLARRLGMPGMDLAALDPAEAVRGIEASAQAAFDPQPQRQHVRQSFASALQCARAGAKVA